MQSGEDKGPRELRLTRRTWAMVQFRSRPHAAGYMDDFIHFTVRALTARYEGHNGGIKQGSEQADTADRTLPITSFTRHESNIVSAACGYQ